MTDFSPSVLNQLAFIMFNDSVDLTFVVVLELPADSLLLKEHVQHGAKSLRGAFSFPLYVNRQIIYRPRFLLADIVISQKLF